MPDGRDKTFRGNLASSSSRESHRRGHCRGHPRQCLTLTSCSNAAGTKFVHVGRHICWRKTCSVAETEKGTRTIFLPWVAFQIHLRMPSSSSMVPALMYETKAMHQRWLDTRKDGHHTRHMKTTFIPPASNQYSWDISPYKNAWHLIEEKLAE